MTASTPEGAPAACLSTGRPPVVGDSGAGRAGRSPAGRAPPLPRAAGVPVSSGPRPFDHRVVDAIAHRIAIQNKSYCFPIRRPDSLQLATGHALRAGIKPPEPRENGPSINGCINRLCSIRWLRRTIRKTYARRDEVRMRGAGFVGRHAGLYVSDLALEFRQRCRQRNQSAMERATATNELGELHRSTRLLRGFTRFVDYQTLSNLVR